MFPSIGISTSTSNGSVSFSTGKKTVMASWGAKKNHSETLIQKLHTLVRNRKLSEIKSIAVDIGPGSFTGTRLAVNVAKTLSYLSGAEIIPISSLECIARGAGKIKTPHLAVIMDAHKSLFYFQRFEISGGKIISTHFENRAYTRTEILSELLPQTLVLGEFPSDFKKILRSAGCVFSKNPKLNFPSAKTALCMLENDPVPWSSLEPMYIRNPEVVDRLAHV